MLLVVLFQIIRNTTNDTLPAKAEGSIRVASYNVHYIRMNATSGSWSLTDWEKRKQSLVEAVGSLEADIVAFQEMESFAGRDTQNINVARSALLEAYPEYKAGAVGDAQLFPSTQPIFFRSEKYTLLNQGWFFFSDSPDEIYSRTFNGSYPAFASWVQLEEQVTGNVFRVLNLHTDFASKMNRSRAIELVAERITPWLNDDESVIVAGDFNARLGSHLHSILEEKGLVFAPFTGSSYHFDYGFNLFGAIDHIAFSEQFVLANQPIIIQKKFSGEWPTDHYPVVVDFKWR